MDIENEGEIPDILEETIQANLKKYRTVVAHYDGRSYSRII